MNTNFKNPFKKRTEPDTPKRVAIFNDIDATRDALSSIGVGEVSHWVGDKYLGYWASAESAQIPTYEGGKLSNIFLIVESEKANRIEMAKVFLNIFDVKNESKAAIKFIEHTKNMLTALNIPMPDGLVVPLTIPLDKTIETDDCIIKINLTQSKIETWRVIVTSK